LPGEVLLIALPFGVAFVVSMLFAPGVIEMLRRRGVGQRISSDGPDSHQSKEGTPTMGGLIIVAGVLSGVLVFAYMLSRQLPGMADAAEVKDILAVVLLMFGYGALGMVDDYLTIHPVRGVRGISSKPKAAAQILLALAFVLWLANVREGGFAPVLHIGGREIISGVIYWVFAVVFIVGMANFVNITDGLDGLVAGLTGLACAGFVATILLVPSRGIESAAVLPIVSTICGAALAFLWFNANPAKVFMGDTGALAIGVALPAIAIIMHREILLIVVGLVFVLDGLSTALQWAVFKFTRVTTGTGRRVFKKSPIHHHFELSGWPEQSVTVRFWVAGAAAAVAAMAGSSYGLW